MAVAVRKRMRDAAFGMARVPRAHFRVEAGGSSAVSGQNDAHLLCIVYASQDNINEYGKEQANAI